MLMRGGVDAEEQATEFLEMYSFTTSLPCALETQGTNSFVV